MLNYLFCLDENYNKQLLTSLNSLNQFSQSNFNVFIIHKEPNTFKSLIKEYNIEFEKINNLQIYKYNSNKYLFPNLENNHISEATYYRFFIEDYIKEDVESLIYLDCDILCLTNPDKILNETISNLLNSNYTIGASVEYMNTENTSELFERLNLSSNLYFNAGVMLINYKLWVENNIKNQLLNAMEEIYEKVNFWDQDILNYVFDGKFLIMSNKLNQTTQLVRNIAKYDLRSTIFLHFAGSNKPWSIEGASINISDHFHKSYNNIFNERYFLINNYRKRGLVDLFKVILFLDIFKLKNPYEFLLLAIKSFIK